MLFIRCFGAINEDDMLEIPVIEVAGRNSNCKGEVGLKNTSGVQYSVLPILKRF